MSPLDTGKKVIEAGMSLNLLKTLLKRFCDMGSRRAAVNHIWGGLFKITPVLVWCRAAGACPGRGRSPLDDQFHADPKLAVAIGGPPCAWTRWRSASLWLQVANVAGGSMIAVVKENYYER
jgi:hypothetical protein